jgi:hypothetical protein
MFNRTNYVTVKDGPTYVTKTTTEYRAPTDESVRLLKEMEEKAREKIIDTFTVKDTHFECKFFQEMDVTTQEMKYVVIYSMNGKKRTVNVRVDRDVIADNYKKLISAVANDIAHAMLAEPFSRSMVK